jgi:hypothetical protein
VIVVGLYRSAKDMSDQPVQYVVTNPASDKMVKPSDSLFVLMQAGRVDNATSRGLRADSPHGSMADGSGSSSTPLPTKHSSAVPTAERERLSMCD